MTVKEAIDAADDVKPNAFTTATKIAWLNKLEGTIASEVFLMAPAEVQQFKYTTDDMSAELLVAAPYDDIYELYLEAMIDQKNGEYNKYQNTMQSYHARYADFVCWFCQNWDPVQGYMKEEVIYGTV